MTEQARTLVVEDDPAVAVVHRGFVESHPRFVVVGEARNGADALQLASALRPDLVLLDLHLPDMNGLDLLAQLRAGKEYDTMPVVVVSADALPATIERALAAGASAYLTKPLDVSLFFSTVDKMLK